MSDFKQCKECKLMLEASEFYVRSQDGLPYTSCKECVKLERKVRYHTDERYRKYKKDRSRINYYLNKAKEN